MQIDESGSEVGFINGKKDTELRACVLKDGWACETVLLVLVQCGRFGCTLLVNAIKSIRYHVVTSYLWSESDKVFRNDSNRI